MFSGQYIELRCEDSGIAHLVFNRKGDSINKLDKATLLEFEQVTDLLSNASEIRGIVVSSAKDKFIVGADIKEFGDLFSRDVAELDAHMKWAHDLFCRFEDLPQPSVAAINGMALGGGLELALCCLVRVMADDAQIGVPEVNLGLFPAYGGTVRLTRLGGPKVSTEWIAGGVPRSGVKAKADGIVDAVCSSSQLMACAVSMLWQMICGELDADLLRQRKCHPAGGNIKQNMDVIDKARQKQFRALSNHLPAAAAAVDAIANGLELGRDMALVEERKAFLSVAKSQAAASLIQGFHNQQALKKLISEHRSYALDVRAMGVLGAGIMGGGIALCSAMKGIPALLQDISAEQVEKGMKGLEGQIDRMLETNRIASGQGKKILGLIDPQTSYKNFVNCDLVVEAIVENLAIKRNTLAALETHVSRETVIASNTSSFQINDLAVSLRRPENFVGMHFFNPVPAMPLVEVVRGAQTSDAAVAAAVNFSARLGKVPIVVQDCPGFLVNRILTPYIRAFIDLVVDGVDFVKIDQAMEAFGWPMGPAYLMDVVGIDTSSHVFEVISSGYPAVMPKQERNPLLLLVASKRYGQKTGAGFYCHENDPEGGKIKTVDPIVYELLGSIQSGKDISISDEEIVERLMLCLVLEAVRVLEAGVVATPGEIDTAVLLGLGFPRYLGGPLKYADWIGIDELVGLSKKYESLGPQYCATDSLRAMAAKGVRFY